MEHTDGFPDEVSTSGGRRRRRVLTTLAVATVLVAAGVGVAISKDGGPEAREVSAHPDQSPPQDLIAAKKVAMSAYFTVQKLQGADGNGVVRYDWNLLDTESGEYRRTDWSWLDVAPGMKTAAVLPRELPAKRIGIVDLSTGDVQRWIKVPTGVGGVQFSPDGKKLLATSYSLNPDGLFKESSYHLNNKKVPGPKRSRSGFYVIDVSSGKAEFTAKPQKDDPQASVLAGGRADFRWGGDGRTVWEPAMTKTGKARYRLDGTPAPAPQREQKGLPASGLSPDGKLAMGTFVGDDKKVVSEVLDAKTGKRAAVVPGQQLLGWADNTTLVAWMCEPKNCSPGKGEFRNRLVIVNLKDQKVTPLTGFREASLTYRGRWNPLFTER
ncbi:hypothetical protein ACWGI8_14050 [Streptomyces sp. NPDC054841]